MRFLSIGPPVSAILPPTGRLPFRRWIRVVVVTHIHVLVLSTGDLHPIYNAPMLGAHMYLDGTVYRCAVPRPQIGLRIINISKKKQQ